MDSCLGSEKLRVPTRNRDKDCQNKVSGGQKQGHLVNMGARWYTCEAGLDS